MAGAAALAQQGGAVPPSGDTAAVTAAPAVASEMDYLSDMPVVLSVSRLAQRLDETPGAVTIIDRDLIRRSGARDLVDLLRLVPGFQTTTSFETDATVATYHGRSDDWANRIQVLVDGRSVYSTQAYGSAGLGLQTLSLDEIERVEVLRGSNSATYGARAFLGVINIISRDVRDTRGVSMHATRGENNVADQSVRVGWGEDQAVFRVVADSRSDNGLRGAFGTNKVERLNLSGRFTLAPGNEIDLRLGQLDVNAGRGSMVPGEWGNPSRMRYLGSNYAQIDWRRVVNQDSDVLVSLSRTENITRDKFPYLDPTAGPYTGIDIQFSGHEYNDMLMAQWTQRPTPQLRSVIGLELRSEKLVSPSAFADRKQVQTDFTRLFGSAEWHITPALVMNAGAMLERSTPEVGTFSPRLMMNWHVLPGHTLRYGVSTAFRPPSAYERYSLVQYRDRNGQNPLTYVRSTGKLDPERILVREAGYHFTASQTALSGDVRAFDETISDGVRIQGDLRNNVISDHFNGDSFQVRGLEWQLDWGRPEDTRLTFTQTWANVEVHNAVDRDMRFRMEHSVARFATSLAVLHQFRNGLDVGLTYSRAEDVSLLSISTRPWLFTLDRIDLRVAQKFRLGTNRAEAALTLQNFGGPVRDGDWQFRLDPRALFTLRVDF